MNISEILRYLGYGKNTPDERTMELIDICINEVEAAADYKSVCRRFNVHISGDDIRIGNLQVKSGALAANLRGCDEVILMAATLSVGVDRILNRNIKLDMAKAAVIQAVAATAIEEYCDRCQREIEEEVRGEGYYVRPRFSPGYGDFSLEVQSAFLEMTDATKLIGITLTDGGIMVPEKSVTAVIGLTKTDKRG